MGAWGMGIGMNVYPSCNTAYHMWRVCMMDAYIYDAWVMRGAWIWPRSHAPDDPFTSPPPVHTQQRTPSRNIAPYVIGARFISPLLTSPFAISAPQHCLD